jgi:hypothetical protein
MFEMYTESIQKAGVSYFLIFLYYHYFTLYFFNMTRTLPYEVQDSIKSLLFRNILLCSIKKMYPTFDMANLSKYRREFLEGAQASTGGRSSKVSTATQ